MDRPLYLPINPSRMLQAGYLVMWCLASIAILLAAIPWLLSLCMWIGLSWFVFLQPATAGRSAELVALHRAGSLWQVELPQGETRDVVLCDDSVLGWACTVLHLRTLDGRQHWRLTLLPDSAEPERLRQLRWYLLHQRESAGHK